MSEQRLKCFQDVGGGVPCELPMRHPGICVGRREVADRADVSEKLKFICELCGKYFPGMVQHDCVPAAGRKDDQGKDRWDLLPVRAVRWIVQVLSRGAEKYAPGNWRKVPDARDRYYAAALRHLTAWRDGEVLDPQWGLPHLAHAACCLIFLMELEDE